METENKEWVIGKGSGAYEFFSTKLNLEYIKKEMLHIDEVMREEDSYERWDEYLCFIIDFVVDDRVGRYLYHKTAEMLNIQFSFRLDYDELTSDQQMEFDEELLFTVENFISVLNVHLEDWAISSKEVLGLPRYDFIDGHFALTYVVNKEALYEYQNLPEAGITT